MPAVVVSAPVRGFGYYNNPYRFAYPYQSVYSYQPSFYGTCGALAGVGVVRDNCLGGTTAVSTGGDGCTCYDQKTGWSGCGNTSNGVCLGPSGSVIVNPII